MKMSQSDGILQKIFLPSLYTKDNTLQRSESYVSFSS